MHAVRNVRTCLLVLSVAATLGAVNALALVSPAQRLTRAAESACVGGIPVPINQSCTGVTTCLDCIPFNNCQYFVDDFGVPSCRTFGGRSGCEFSLGKRACERTCQFANCIEDVAEGPCGIMLMPECSPNAAIMECTKPGCDPFGGGQPCRECVGVP